MKLLTLGDLHLDFYFHFDSDPLRDVPRAQLDSVTHCILAGDLTNAGHKKYDRCLQWLVERMPGAQFFVIPGNHDYYGGQIDREDKMRDAVERNGAGFLQKSELIYGEQRFLCCTLWTDMRLNDAVAKDTSLAITHMSDYHDIRVARENHKKLHPAHTVKIHRDHRDWLAEKLAEPFGGETTVITHHAPHANAIDGRPKMSACYASDLEELILAYQPKRWLFGHTHYRCRFNIGQTELTNVSLGYPGQFPYLDDLERFTLEFYDWEVS